MRMAKGEGLDTLSSTRSSPAVPSRSVPRARAERESTFKLKARPQATESGMRLARPARAPPSGAPAPQPARPLW